MRILVAGNNWSLNSDISELLLGYGESDTASDCFSAVELFAKALAGGCHYNMLVFCCDDPSHEISADMTLIRGLENRHAGLSHHATICALPIMDDSAARQRLHPSQDPDFYCLTYPFNLQELLIVARLCKSRISRDKRENVFSRYSAGFLYLRLLADLSGSRPLENKPRSISIIS